MTKIIKDSKTVTVKKTRMGVKVKKHTKDCMHCTIMEAIVGSVEDGTDPVEIFEALGAVAGDIISQQEDPNASALMFGHMMLSASSQYFAHMARSQMQELPRQLMELLQAQVEAPPKDKMN